MAKQASAVAASGTNAQIIGKIRCRVIAARVRTTRTPIVTGLLTVMYTFQAVGRNMASAADRGRVLISLCGSSQVDGGSDKRMRHSTLLDVLGYSGERIDWSFVVKCREVVSRHNETASVRSNCVERFHQLITIARPTMDDELG